VIPVEAIRQAVQGETPAPLRWAPRQAAGLTRVRQAAVLVPVLAPENASDNAPLELLFIVRPQDASKHAGQVAFPGGVADDDDPGPVETALREAEEELGIPRQRPEILGLLPPFPTHTGFVIRPVVGLIRGPLPLVPSPTEVAATFTVPLSELFDPARRRVMRSRWGPGLPEYPLWFWPFTPTPIWGATGHILATLLTRLTRLEETR
jgi:8-oxo-dGTP pyrophosphatase MutT (NUDIX family)